MRATRTIGHVALFFDHTVAHTTGHYVRRSLEQRCQVDVYHPRQAGELLKTGYDLYLCVDDSSHHLYLSRLKPSAIWIIDSHMSYRADLIMARRFEHVFVAGKDGAERFRRDGLGRAEWLPLACDAAMQGTGGVPKTYDVAFIGGEGWGRRRRLLRRLRREFPNSYIGLAPHTEVGRIYSRARIVFNCSIRNDLNMRVFEALASGSCLVTNADTAGLTDLFIPGRHLLIYSSEEQAVSIIHHYLINAEERETIALAGMNEVLARHTYMDRVQRIVEVSFSMNGTPRTASAHSGLQDMRDRVYQQALDRLYKVEYCIHRMMNR